MTEKSRQSASSSRYQIGDQESSEHEEKFESTLDTDEEKATGLNGTEYLAWKEEEVGGSRRGPGHSRRSQDSRSLRTTRSHQSRAGGDGYTCFDAEPDNSRPNKSKSGVVMEQPYLVTWDGDADPENPRSMSNLRRWIIVLICSASSLCV
jgi:hypothetical protein